MSILPFSQSEYESRWAAVYAGMREAGLRSAVVWSRGGGNFDRFQEVFYLTNYYSANSGYMYDGLQKGTRAAAHCAVVLQPGQEPILVADDPTLDLEMLSTRRVTADTDVVAALAKVLQRERIDGEVGFVGFDCISAKHMSELQVLVPQIRWVPHDDLILDVRIIKSAAELDCFRYAGETVSNALTAVFKTLFAGGSEADAAGEAAREVYRRQGSINFVNVAHGPFTADRLTDSPIAGYSSQTPQHGELIRAWVYGAMYQGYWLDPGRTTVLGLKPTPEQKRLIETCAKITEDLRSMIKPGARVADLAAIAQKMQNDYQEGEYDNGWYIYGHGNGLFFEPPFIAANYEGKHTTFRENMVGSTEAFLMLPGVGGAGFEQNFIVTKDGSELLTTTPMIWW